jgi:toxin-antitoxin system PIN domain toxin
VILPDVNVLVYAMRKDAAEHALARDWLSATLSSDVRFGISPLSLSAVVRLVTNGRIYENPSTLGEAFAFADTILEQSNCEVVEPGEGHWHIFKRLCLETKTTARGVSDVWYAALAIEHGCEWITFDRDFAKFSGLKWRAPTLSR